ncbi:MAG: hypothetical protein BMS9Abin02_0569 [Anaerolineae bacterium]|nr:MAG: hypothetical protein BMS9Abin02_0569 [Anaerolineae bacterium]
MLHFLAKMQETCKITVVEVLKRSMNRRPLVLIITLILGVAALVSAQEDEPGLVPAGHGIPLSSYPTHEVSGVWQPIELEPIDRAPLSASQLPGDQGADLCVDATIINLPGGGGGVTDTRSMTRSDDDPALSCMWGKPSDPGGYRTIWYKVTPEESGYLRVFTNGSTYDTVLAIYSSDLENACVNLQQLSCNDDSNFLSSEATLLVLSGKTYYIEVADWQFEAPGETFASLSAVFTPINEWQVAASLNPARSRHVTVMNGDNAFVIGGQIINASGIPEILNSTQIFNTVTGEWKELAKMCLPGQACSSGYANTTAALIDRKIYLPSGYVGNVDEYDGTHWVYDIASNTWSKANNDIWNDKEPTVYGAAVVEGQDLLRKYYYSGGLVGPMPLEGSVSGDQWSASADMDVYLPASDRWFTNIIPPMPSGRFGHMAALQRMDDNNGVSRIYICAIGGIGKNDEGNPILITDGSCYNSTGSGGWDKNLPELNHPRYFAGSAVDRDGNWVIFGGTDSAGKSVPSTEVYDRVNNRWIELDTRFDLGGTSVLPLRPARSWPRGEFKGQFLYSFGGQSNQQNGDFVLNLVERVKIPRLFNAPPEVTAFMPLVFNRDLATQRNSTFESAQPLSLNQPISSEFVDANDFADVFFVNIPFHRSISVNLQKIPSGADYDLYVYNENKGLLGLSRQPGNNNESVNLNVAPGRVYIVVERILPAPGSTPIPEPYQLLVQG